jgi:riboflavin synthase
LTKATARSAPPLIRSLPVFTGIIQAVAKIAALRDQDGLRTFIMEFPEGFCQDLAIGASVSHDGVCLTVTETSRPPAPALM